MCLDEKIDILLNNYPLLFPLNFWPQCATDGFQWYCSLWSPSLSSRKERAQKDKLTLAQCFTQSSQGGKKRDLLQVTSTVPHENTVKTKKKLIIFVVRNLSASFI